MQTSSDWYSTLSQRDKRSLIFHILYAAEGCEYQASIQSLVDNLNRGFELSVPMDSDIVNTAAAVISKQDSLDELYKPLLANWRFDRLGICTKLILRYAVWELYNTDTASTIIINEAIELAKAFAEKDAYKFINGILDEIVKGITPPAESPEDSNG
jgi:transcription antitermination protein NusB